MYEIGSIVDTRDYRQTFYEAEIKKNKEQILELQSSIAEKTGYNHIAIVGGLALKLFCQELNFEIQDFTSDADIIVDLDSFFAHVLKGDVLGSEYYFSSVFEVPYTNTEFKIDKIQVVNSNPAAHFLIPVLKRKQKTNKYCKQRVKTYSNLLEVNTGSVFVKRIIRYLASFDITLTQVAIVDNKFIYGQNVIPSLAYKELNLTNEQIDMYRLAKSSTIISKHLDIVNNRINKYQNRYGLTLNSEVQKCLQLHPLKT